MKRALFFIFLFSNLSLAEDSLLKCLGQEEHQLFKKRAEGSLLRLNQDLIAEFIQFPTYQPLKDIYYAEICQMRNQSPSYTLLKLLFKNQNQIFKTPDATEVQSFINDVPTIFLTFIAQVRTYSKSKECLEKVLPNLANMEQVILSFQNEKSSRLLFFENETAVSILERIPYIQSRLDNCEDQRKKQIKAKENTQEQDTTDDQDQ